MCGIKGVAQGVEIVISQSSQTHDSASCVEARLGIHEEFPPGFRKDIGEGRATSIARKILSADSLSASGFRAGRLSSVIVPKFDPNSIAGTPPTLSDARRRSQTIGAILRPCLLELQPRPDELHDYQQIGVNWLASRTAAVLADDMGLGKTAQAITALRRLQNQSPLNTALVVCPKQLMANWENELRRWAPELSWSRLTPPASWRARAWDALFNRVHVLIVNYEQLSSLIDLDKDHNFSVVILDEAHRVRNATSQTTSDLRRIKRERTWALTGTPLERAPSDIWTILSTVEPRRFALTRAPSSEEAIRARARPYMLRRMKRDFLPGLPEEIEVHETLELSERQRTAYNQALVRFKSAPDFELLSRLNELLTLCDLEPKSKQSTKLDRIIELLREIATNDEKGVVFSHHLAPLDALGARLSREHLGHLQLRGDQPPDQREETLDRFETDPTATFLLASTRVGGEGLNLLSANHVVFINRWWNPSANKQAKDRVARMGQKRRVIVHSFTCRDTVEELLDTIIEEKGRLATAIVDPLATLTGEPSILTAITSQLRTAPTASP